VPRSSRTGTGPTRNPVPLRLTSYRPGRRPQDRRSAPSPTATALLSFQRPRLQKQITSDPGHFPAVTSSNELSLVLPVPPSINHQYATVNGRRLLSAVGREYKSFIARRILVCLAQSPHRTPLLDTFRDSFLALSIRFYFNSPLRRDLDGGLKIAQDAICEALALNDNRKLEIHLIKSLDKSQPRIEVSLRALPRA
jgi:crossover junction endodeoxyribonuclease RusA